MLLALMITASVVMSGTLSASAAFTGPGFSAGDPCQTAIELLAAVAAADSGDTVYLADGTYVLSAPLNLDGVSLQGESESASS